MSKTDKKNQMHITTLTSSATTRTPCHVLNKVNQTVKYKRKCSKAIMGFLRCLITAGTLNCIK